MTIFEDQIDQILGAEIAPGEPGAAVAVLRDGEVLHCKGYGLANVEWGVPITPDTVFHIASLTKQFTATAIMMLKERGLLSLEAPLEAYLPEFPTQRGRITVRHLLNHTSGIKTYTTLANFFDGTSRHHVSLDELVARIASLPVEFEPGARFLYNNSGYVLLGAIIEQTSGLKYRDFLAREIFAPLGMSQTRYLFDEPIVPQRAAGYRRGHDAIENAPYESATYFHAAGGLGSTLRDLVKWNCAIRKNIVVSAQSFAEMRQPTILNDGREYPYGFGLGMADYYGRRVYHHAGGLTGFACHMLHVRDADVTTILLSNLFQFPFDRAVRKILRNLFDPDGSAPVPTPVAPHLLDACVGSFRAEGTTGTWARQLVRSGEGLIFAEPGGPHLVPIGEGHFCEKNDPEVEYVFSEPEKGAYTKIHYRTPLFPPTVYLRCDPSKDLR